MVHVLFTSGGDWSSKYSPKLSSGRNLCAEILQLFVGYVLSGAFFYYDKWNCLREMAVAVLIAVFGWGQGFLLGRHVFQSCKQKE